MSDTPRTDAALDELAEDQRGQVCYNGPTFINFTRQLERQNAALASALRKVVAWYDSKDCIDVLIDIEKEVKEALAAEGGAK